MLARNPEVPMPPICAWSTFLGVVDQFKETGVPNFVGHDSLPKVAPDVRSRVITSMRALTLISPKGESQPHLRKMVEARGTDAWQATLRLLASTAYPYLTNLNLFRVDSAALREAFVRHLKRESGNLSKAEAFYLNLAREAGIRLSEALQKRVATSDAMSNVRGARKKETPPATPPTSQTKDTPVQIEATKPVTAAQERVDRIMDLLRMFSGDGLPAKELDAVLTLLDYAKRKAANN
jgi:hypothetical protein